MSSLLDSTWLIIPTASRHQYLCDIFESSQIPESRRILIRTEAGPDLPGALNIQVLDVLNIQYWWNIGIQVAINHGAKFVAILNDDTKISEGDLELLLRLMLDEDTDLSYANPTLTGGWGHCFLLRIDSSVRPDERFFWWKGDHDLEMQANKGGGVSIASITIQNLHSNELTSGSLKLQALIARDISRFRKKYPIYTVRKELIPRGVRKLKRILSLKN
jgi:hypothetical protein